MSEETKFRNIFQDLSTKGKLVKPRNMWVKEIENYNYELKRYWRFCSFTARKLNLTYIKKEFQWYLRANKFDTSIIDHAKMWKDLVNADGSINSNYGQYIFGETDGKLSSFDMAIAELRADKDSRRALMMILQPYHLAMETKDVPCTISIGFRIRSDKLNMTVRMRSQDAVFGMGNDAPCFSFIHEMMLNALRQYYPDMKQGTYYHSADSFHVYERHFDMVDEIALKGKFVEIECPRISGPDEVRFLRGYWKNETMPLIPKQFRFSRWLLEETPDGVHVPGDSDKQDA